MTECCNCHGTEIETMIRYYKDKTILESARLAHHWCLKCYGPICGAISSISFDPIFALHNWVYSKSKKLAPYYISLRLYQYNNKQNQGWAWVTVINGDYLDIKDGHVRDLVPELITEESLRMLAQECWNIAKKNFDKNPDFCREYYNLYNKYAPIIGLT